MHNQRGFHAHDIGKRYGALTVTTSDSATPQIVNMTGVGTEVVLQPATLRFNSRAWDVQSAPNGDADQRPTRLLTSAESLLEPERRSASGEATTDFSQTNDCGSVVGPGASCTLSVSFNPLVLSSLIGTMNINDNFGDSPQQVALTGTGTASLKHSVPFIHRLAPSQRRPGTARLALRVSGTGFVRALRSMERRPLTTAFRPPISERHRAHYFVAQAGTARVTAVNPGPGGGASNVQFFSIANPRSAVTFSRTDIPVGTAPQQIVAGDFNGDGIEDLAVAASGANSLSILLGKGNGNFTAQASPATGRQPVSLAAGDFNNDGKLDVAVGNLQDSTVEVLLGNGDGTFTAAASGRAASRRCPSWRVISIRTAISMWRWRTASSPKFLSCSVPVTVRWRLPPRRPGEGANPSALAAGDYNGDGDLDLAEVNNLDLTLVALLGNGDGTFQTKGTPPETGHNPLAIAAGDFNNDGHLDVAVANQTDGTISVFPGNGDGTFQAGQTYAAGASPSAISTADVNGDAKLDLLAAKAAANTISLWFGSGRGKFGSRKDYPTGSSPAGLAIADFNGDGLLDIAVTDSGANTVSVMLQPEPNLDRQTFDCGSRHCRCEPVDQAACASVVRRK